MSDFSPESESHRKWGLRIPANNYVRPHATQMEIFAGRVAFCRQIVALVCASCSVKVRKSATDGRTPDRYITLNAGRGQREKLRGDQLSLHHRTLTEQDL